MKKFGILSILIMLSLSACVTTDVKETTSTDQATAGAAEQGKNESLPGTLMIFNEQEDNSDLFTTRIFVNPNYMHISDSRYPANFILLNRAERTIYNVTQEDKTIFVIKPKDVSIKPPIDIVYEEESQPSGAIPKINGREATHYKFTANNAHCYDAVVLPEDFLPDVLAAMREFRMILAGEHATTVDRTPKEMLDACDLALNVFYSTKHMDHGLPIREWDRNGYLRFLKDFRTGITAPLDAFELPADFQRYSVGDVLVNQNTNEPQK